MDTVDAAEYTDSVSLRVERVDGVRLRGLGASSVSLRVSLEAAARSFAQKSLLRVEEPEGRRRSPRSRPEVATS